MKTKPLLCTLAAMILWAGPGNTEAETRYNLGCSLHDCLIPTWTAKPPAPFRILGHRLDAGALPLIGTFGKFRYRAALWWYDSPRACLSGAKTADGHDLLQVNWTKLDTTLAKEVCLFRLVDAMRDPERVVTWFQALGYRAHYRRHPPGHFREGQTVVFADWHGDVPGQAPMQRFDPIFGTRPFGIGIRLSQAGAVLNINLSITTK